MARLSSNHQMGNNDNNNYNNNRGGDSDIKNTSTYLLLQSCFSNYEQKRLDSACVSWFNSNVVSVTLATTFERTSTNKVRPTRAESSKVCHGCIYVMTCDNPVRRTLAASLILSSFFALSLVLVLGSGKLCRNIIGVGSLRKKKKKKQRRKKITCRVLKRYLRLVGLVCRRRRWVVKLWWRFPDLTTVNQHSIITFQSNASKPCGW